MRIDKAEAILGALLEDLAAIEHERWSHWQAHLHARAERRADGSLVIPAELVARWERQIATPYAQLSEPEKDMDREQVRRYLALIARAFAENEA
ncbi:MAG TPA: hypothetical protein VI168_06820 [Croceibacterium sp.]